MHFIVANPNYRACAMAKQHWYRGFWGGGNSSKDIPVNGVFSL